MGEQMIRSFNGKTPRIADTAFVSEFAYVVGDVEIGEGSGVWPGAVIRGDFGSIQIGRNSHIEDNAVVHAWKSLIIGDNVTVGHSAVIHCLRIGNNVLVGNNATVLDDTEIGDFCIIGANSMVRTGQKIPDRSFVVGVPAKIKAEYSSDEIQNIYREMAGRYSETTARKGPELSLSELARQYKAQGL
jgi:carbonic anhydrase/acetyltransferase-like protein (isoleucine patch superfamily)